jgi:hypothetical protein
MTAECLGNVALGIQTALLATVVYCLLQWCSGVTIWMLKVCMVFISHMGFLILGGGIVW